MAIPPGHTPFSWSGRVDAHVPPGHTLFSWGKSPGVSGGIAETGQRQANSQGFVPTINQSAAAKLAAGSAQPQPCATKDTLLALVASPEQLDAHMASHSYVDGATFTLKDLSVHKALCPAPTLPHAARWFAHIKTFSDAKLAALSGAYINLVPSLAVHR